MKEISCCCGRVCSLAGRLREKRSVVMGKRKVRGSWWLASVFFFCKGGGEQPFFVLPRERSRSGLCLEKIGGLVERLCAGRMWPRRRKKSEEGAAAWSRLSKGEEKVLDDGGCLVWKGEAPSGDWGRKAFLLARIKEVVIGGQRLKEEIDLGFFFFCFFNFFLLIFIGKMLLGPQNWSSPFFFFFFCKFWNICFLYFLKMSNININSMRKINYFKNNTWKVERVQKIFEKLNSFETMLKKLKRIQI